jgi:glutamate racemase
MFPYGSRDTGMLRGRVARIAEMLLDEGAKLLVIACNTATAIGAGAAREVAAERGIEVVTVVEPEAEIAAAITASGGSACWRRRTRSRAAPTGARSRRREGRSR